MSVIIFRGFLCLYKNINTIVGVIAVLATAGNVSCHISILALILPNDVG